MVFEVTDTQVTNSMLCHTILFFYILILEVVKYSYLKGKCPFQALQIIYLQS
jgi:hypothetical protein